MSHSAKDWSICGNYMSLPQFSFNTVDIEKNHTEKISYFLYEQCRKEVKFIPVRVGCIFPGNQWLQFEARAKRVL